MELTLNQFENLNLYSNENMKRIIGSVVNKSSNAVLVSMFEDSVVLLDHKEGQFYVADYTFDAESLTLKLEGFDPVDLRKEEDNFKEKVFDFFESDEMDASELSESYVDDVMRQEVYINELISEAMSVKDFDDIIDYAEVTENNKDLAIAEENFFKKYVERLATHPLNEIKMFNWTDEVIVSLMETEKSKLVNSTTVEKAHDLWKRETFKTAFAEACVVFESDVEEGIEKIKELMEDFPQVYFLDGADRKTLFGKTILSEKALRGNMDEFLDGLDKVFESELEEARNEYLIEQEPEVEEAPAEEEGEEAEEEKAPELTPEELTKISEELKKIAEKVEDEKLKEKLDGLIGKLEGAKEEGTRPDVVKDAIQLLTL